MNPDTSYITAARELGERLASLEGKQEALATKSDFVKIKGQLESLATKEEVGALSNTVTEIKTGMITKKELLFTALALVGTVVIHVIIKSFSGNG